jgi:hypothetical protein
MEFIQTFCILDGANRILQAGGSWDSFAAANDGEMAKADRVRGMSVLDVVEGFDMRALIAAALASVRQTGAAFVMHYRCDSPGIRRFMRMNATALGGGRLLILHDFLREERIGDGAVRWLFAPDAQARKCSICCAVEFGQVWIDPFETPDPHPAHVRYTICPECHDRASGILRLRRRDRGGGVVLRFPRSAQGWV